MALGRKKGGARKEPLFGLPAALADLRLSAADRIAVAEDKPKKSSARSCSAWPRPPAFSSSRAKALHRPLRQVPLRPWSEASRKPRFRTH